MNPSLGSVPSRAIEARIGAGLNLRGRAWLAPEPRGLVAVVHGIGEHSGRYGALAGDLVRAGYTVVALDLPGHGESPGPRGDMPSWVMVRDQMIPALFRAPLGFPGQPERLPQVLFGHSLGAVMALDYAIAHPRGLAAVIGSAPGLSSAMPPWWKLVLANVARVTAPSIGFQTGLDESGMSRDPEVVRLRAEDRAVHDKISPRLYFEFTEARQRVLRDARRIAVPTLLLHGEADRVVDPAGTRACAQAAPRQQVRLITYPDAYHEILNDLARDQVVRDMVEWLGGVLR